MIDAFAAQRASWADGFAIDAPWCALTLRATDDGFAVQSPRFADDPHAHRTDDLSVALTAADGRERVRRRAAIEPAPVRFDDTLLAVGSRIADSRQPRQTVSAIEVMLEMQGPIEH